MKHPLHGFAVRPYSYGFCKLIMIKQVYIFRFFGDGKHPCLDFNARKRFILRS